jgi:hypothetical protein
MRDLVKAMVSFSWAMSLFGVRRLGDVLALGSGSAPAERAAAPLDSITSAAARQLGGPIKDAFDTGDALQRSFVDAAFGVAPPAPAARLAANGAWPGAIGGGPAAASAPGPRGHPGRLDVSNVVVLGEGLAAGLGDFTWSTDSQRDSFPAQMARQMDTRFDQPLIQAPGLIPAADATVVPSALQTSVLEEIETAARSNLSIPGLTLADALELRPREPLVHRRDAKRTAVNLVLGARALIHGEDAPLPTPAEAAAALRPTLAVVALGYAEAVEAAVRGDPGLLAEPSEVYARYQQLLGQVCAASAEVLVLNVPDPMDTALVSSLEDAARTLKVEPGWLRSRYGLSASDLLTVAGLNEIGFQIFGSTAGPLPLASVLGAETADRITERVGQWNEAIRASASEHGAALYDLHGLLLRLRAEGVPCGRRRLDGGYLGGFYSLNGGYPGATGQAVIANELLALLNRRYGAAFPALDLAEVAQRDPVASYRPAEGPAWTEAQLPRPPAATRGPGHEPPLRESAPRARARRPSAPLVPAHPEAPPRLQLPARLEQVLPLSKAASYFGDGIAAQNARDERTIQWGGGSLLFGGLAIVDTHLEGDLRLRFSPPEGDLTRFEVSFLDGLRGDDAVLAAPQFFRMAFQQSRVDEVPGQVSSGTLNLATGEVTDLTVYARYASTALFALVSVNPTFPRQPLAFPGPYGSAWAKFTPRADGQLDFTFYGSTFVPLGPGIRWPLNFAGPSRQFATIPAAGTVMHPHLHLSTREPERPSWVVDEESGEEPPGAPPDDPPAIPFNSVVELTLHTRNTSFGDAFTLDAPDLGGPATGRSHVLGRVQLQFGERSGDAVPVAVMHLDSGGLLNPMPASPISAAFPGGLYHGPRGFNEYLRFPLRTYSLDDLAILDDPFDIAMGLVDLRTGRFVNPLLHRGFIHQDLIFALLRVEPRTPGSSFYFRGPARLQRGSGGRMVFRHQAEVRVPYPQGFLFPRPNLTTGFPIGADSVLDPFLWVRAVADDPEARGTKEGGEEDVLSSLGERFSYRYRVSNDPEGPPPWFEYENHSQDGAFRLRRLYWIGFGNALEAETSAGEYDTLTFTGVGEWTKDGVRSTQQASVQVSTAPRARYVGIQIGWGDVSDVNTKPRAAEEAWP